MTAAPTCYHCGWRDSCQTSLVDGRPVPTCAECLRPPRPMSLEEALRAAGLKDAPSRAVTIRARLVRAIDERPGCTAAELAEAIGVEHQLGQWPSRHAARPYQTLREVLTRMSRAGQIRVESTDDQPRYWPRKGRGAT